MGGDGRSVPWLDDGPPRVAYQGRKGAFSELAIRSLFRGPFRALGLPSFKDVARALVSDEADYALVPVENSTAGPVRAATVVLDTEGVRTWVDIVMPIRHCLLAPPGARLDTVVRAFSHPMALAQCRRFLRIHRLEGVAMVDTAGAAELVAAIASRQVAAIASSAAAAHHGLDVLIAGVEDRGDNRTRFLLVGRADAPRPDIRSSSESPASACDGRGRWKWPAAASRMNAR